MAFQGIDRFIDSSTFQSPVQKTAIKLCQLSGMIKDAEICPDAVMQYSPILFNAMSNYLMAKDRWCNEKLGVCTHMKVESEDLHKVVDNILATKPKYLENDDFVDKMYEQMAKEIAAGDTDREIIKAVHISDVHIDMEYAEGSAAKCGSFLCCRAKFG